jgi:hypothetical protein
MALTNGLCDGIADNLDQVCELNRGGLKLNLYVANLGQIASTAAGTPKEVDAITMATNPATSAPYFWYRAAFAVDSANFTNEGVFDVNTYANQSVTFAFNGLTKEQLAVLEGMMIGQLVFIVKDFKNKAYILGRIGGLKMSAMNAGSGTAAGDRFGAEVTFTGAETEIVNTVKPGTTISVWDGVSATTTVTL